MTLAMQSAWGVFRRRQFSVRPVLCRSQSTYEGARDLVICPTLEIMISYL